MAADEIKGITLRLSNDDFDALMRVRSAIGANSHTAVVERLIDLFVNTDLDVAQCIVDACMKKSKEMDDVISKMRKVSHYMSRAYEDKYDSLNGVIDFYLSLNPNLNSGWAEYSMKGGMQIRIPKSWKIINEKDREESTIANVVEVAGSHKNDSAGFVCFGKKRVEQMSENEIKDFLGTIMNNSSVVKKAIDNNSAEICFSNDLEKFSSIELQEKDFVVVYSLKELDSLKKFKQTKEPVVFSNV